MARVQVDSNVRAEALQVVPMPKAQAVQQRYDPNSSQAFQLASALGAAQPLIDKMKEKALDNEEAAARQYALSMSPDELRKKVDNGEIPMWKSPLWAATIQHVAGDNTSKAVFREAEQKVVNGEFKTQQELDAYIKEQRDGALSGKSSYEIAGFDKNFHLQRDNLYNKQTDITTKRLRTEGVQVATEDLANGVAEITGEQFNGKTNQEKVDYILTKYDRHRKASVVNDEAARSVMDATVLKLAAAGQKDLVDAFLASKLPNNGPTIETFLDVRNGASTGRAIQLRNTAETQWNHQQNEAQKRYVQAEQQVILNGANAQADELVSMRNGATMPDVTVPTENGGTKVIKGIDLVTAAVERQMAANPNMDYAEQVRLYKNNGVVNQQWKKEFSTAVYNLGEITIDAQGKPSGTLLKGTDESLQKFSIARQVSEQYAKDLVGEDNYKILNKIQALREAGIPDTAQAAGVVNQINRRQYEPQTWGKIQKDVASAVGDITNPGIFTGRFWSELFRGEFGEGTKNIIPIQGNVQELAEAYVQARIAPDAKSAVQMATDYMSKAVVQVNNTMYMKADLPSVPQGEDDIKWFERYQKEVLLPRLQKMGIDPSISDLTLLPQKGGQKMYVVANQSMPLPREDGIGTLVVTSNEIEKWITGQIAIRNTNAATDANKNLDKQKKRVYLGPAPK